MKKIIKWPTILMISLGSLITLPVKSQTHNVKKHFIYKSVDIGARPITLGLFFIISDRKTIDFKGEKYSSFVFSQDSTNVCGYIRFSQKDSCYFFLSKNYTEDPDDQCTEIKYPQKIFPFSNGESKRLCGVGDLGSYFSLYTKYHNGIFEMKIQTGPRPTHGPKLNKIVFSNMTYPAYIEFSDPLLMTTVKAYPE